MIKKTNKTEHVLKLLTGNSSNTAKNPILNKDFKEEIIEEKIQTLTQSPVVEEEKKITPIPIKIDVIEELVKENIPDVLNRFKACDCELCQREILINTLRQTEPVYVDNDEEHKYEILKIKEENRQQVIAKIVKNVIHIKTNPIHK